jgi:dephospho-CoA kinase
MLVIGVTGGLGAGKSTVAAMFKRLGATVLDADTIAHQLMEPKRLAWREVVKTFGDNALNSDQTINRRWLAERIFHDENERKTLERILHPRVLRHIKRTLGRLRGVDVVALDVPLLLETDSQRIVDVLVVVTASAKEQRLRLSKKFGWSEEEINARMAAQWDVSAKAALADVVVDNSGGVDATRTQVKRIWSQLRKRSKQS